MEILTTIAVVFVMVQVSVMFTSVWLHRSITHKALSLKPSVSFLMHLWVTGLTGLDPKKWMIVHRKHHAFVDASEDPHSPRVLGFWKVLFLTPWLYHKGVESNNKDYGKDYKNDLIDNFVILRYKGLIGLFSLIVLFGWKGCVIWVIHLLFYGLIFGLLNSANHYLGSRPYDSKSYATNIFLLAIFTAGEGWHFNHHESQSSARFGKNWKQPDLGWILILALSKLGLAKIRKPE